ncbi:ATP-binding protein [Arthrobacter frigidicola]|nr:ATP-binding protein [Arthrobacter frigidicola]
MKPPLLRSPDGLVAGVCGGLALHLGLRLRVVRVLMVLLALAGGAGVFLYAWLWIFVPMASDRLAAPLRFVPPAPTLKAPPAPALFLPAATAPPSPATPHPPSAPSEPGNAAPPVAGAFLRPGRRTGGRLHPGRKELLLGVALLLLAGVFLAQELGFAVSLRQVLPVAAAGVGAVLAWSQLDDARREGLRNKAGADRAAGLARLLLGLVLVMVGVLVMVSGAISWDLTWATLLATGAVLAGVALVLAPWALRFWKDFEDERAGRVREAARAEIAAHLHDSVLQTLALIQNRAGSEQDVVRLARAQERELRHWLYADPAGHSGNLTERLRALAGEVEDSYGHPVEVVAVGDAPLTAGQEALAQAAREAIINAAKHAGGTVSVYLEAGPSGSEAFIRDRGPGFDPLAVPADRLGIRESITTRMQRHGGAATIRSGPDGTEVHLKMPEQENRSHDG